MDPHYTRLRFEVATVSAEMASSVEARCAHRLMADAYAIAMMKIDLHELLDAHPDEL